MYITCCFALASFKTFSLILTFDILNIMYLGTNHFEFTLFEILCSTWIWMSVSFHKSKNFSAIISSNKSLSLSHSLFLLAQV